MVLIIERKKSSLRLTNRCTKISRRILMPYGKIWTLIRIKRLSRPPQQLSQIRIQSVSSAPTSLRDKSSRNLPLRSPFFWQIREEKEVPKDSAEAKAYLSSLHTPVSGNVKPETSKPVARRPVKRKSNLEEMAKGGKPAKLNVLEKSRLDWAGFVDREGINDDLKRFNKDGYVERQEFLKRTR